jgi:hypothetical protein
MQTANYILNLITAFAPENKFGQDALEWAILTGLVPITYDRQRDLDQLARQ